MTSHPIRTTHSASTTTKNVVGIALAVSFVLTACQLAHAKAPLSGPTLVEIQERAKQAEADARAKAVEAQKDPNKEAIDAFAVRGKTELKDFGKLTLMILDADTAGLQSYRMPAAEALVKRFQQENWDGDANVRQIRLDVAVELCELLKAPAKDDVGLAIAEYVFGTWYRPPLVNNHWRKDAKQGDRQKAYIKIKKFLKDSQKK
ncbi:MAG: hypothetical protein K8T90_00515 [Planctomycetes bacterium]|nr:hypothetical protein [Planctomycetota bacterium]